MLSRSAGTSAFSRQVMARDGGRCVLCHAPAAAAVHLLDPRLWDDGGDHADNGAALCETHRLAALTTELPLDEIRAAAGIVTLCLPPQLYSGTRYDRWGNPTLSDGRRARGEIFGDPEVQGWLSRGSKLDLFLPWVKYPRTFVLPWSESIGDGDCRMASVARFEGSRVVVTEKMDGENVTLYADHRHTRSLTRKEHPSRRILDEHWEALRGRIPDGWRICAEYLYVEHSVTYRDLSSYLHAFSVWDTGNTCLEWDGTVAFLRSLNVETVRVLYDGPFDPERVHQSWKRQSLPGSEGYVVRLAGPIPYREFRHCVGKFIRSGYSQAAPLEGTSWRAQQLSAPLLPCPPTAS